MEMRKRIEQYINEDQHDINDLERILDERVFEISEQHSQLSWYGLESVGIDKVTLEDNSIIYLVEVETATELVKQTATSDEIYNTLVNRKHDAGDSELVALFVTEKKAYDFIDAEYPAIDVEAEVAEILEAK